MNELYKNHHVTQMHSNGTTAYETFMTILPTPLITFVTILFESVLCTYITKREKWLFIIEYIIFVLPVIFSVTVCSTYLRSILVTVIILVSSLFLFINNLKPSKPITDKFGTNFLTNARSTINILSVIAILAVDFNIFPRKFAKTESFGYSLMDVGVGLFMYSNGIVAPEAKRQKNSLYHSVYSTSIIFALGMIRFIFVKQTDYNVPVSEYGVHWNFFITLGVTKIICAFILHFITKLQHILMTAIFIVTFHEILLQISFEQFVLTDKLRDNFIGANREGIISCLGYISIYLFSVYFGNIFLTKDKPGETMKYFTFIKHCCVTLVLSIILEFYFGTSRKLANSGYCFWILFIGIFMTSLFYLMQIFLWYACNNKLHTVYSPIIFEAINYNGLVFFLTGNVLTGFVNMTFNTLTLNNSISLTILILYMFLNCLIVTLFYCKQFKFKL